MISRRLAFHFLGILIIIPSLVFVPFIKNKIASYALQQTKKKLGTEPLSQKYQDKIRYIASCMDISQPFQMYKMNHAILTSMGYFNAFMIWPNLYNIFTFGPQPLFYANEEFFDDISESEFNFIIAHELIHAQQHDCRYVKIIELIAMIIFIIFLITFFYYIRRFTSYKISSTKAVITGLSLVFAFDILLNIGELYHRRHIEMYADQQALLLTHNYNGCLKTIDRWQKNFRLTAHNPYGGIFSDHPSCLERKNNCLTLQKLHESKS